MTVSAVRLLHRLWRFSQEFRTLVQNTSMFPLGWGSQGMLELSMNYLTYTFMLYLKQVDIK